MVDSDPDAALFDDIPINSNHQIVPNPGSQWNSNNDHVKHHNRGRHGHHRRGGPPKHHHHARAKNGLPFDDTSDYFELAMQARLLSNGDKIPSNTATDPANYADIDIERGSEARDRGKGVDHAGGSKHKGSRFQWNKSFPNQKNKHTFDNPRGEGSVSFNGLGAQRRLVRNGCISPDNVARNAGPSGRFSNQVVGTGDKGKGKVGARNSSRNHKTEGHGVMFHEPQATSLFNENQHGINQRRKNYFTGKRKHRIDQINLGESSSSVLAHPPHPSQKLAIANSSGGDERERDPCSDEYWSMEESELNNEELADQSAKISQVESDEMLARRLQEQFNKEAQNFQVTEEEDDDAIIARALQEEDEDYDDDDLDIVPFRRNHRGSGRDRSMEHLYSRTQHFSLRGPPMQTPNHRRTQMRFNGPDMDYEMLLISQLRRGLNSSNMDIDTRLSILEALEEAFESQNDMDISGEFYPGFHDDEYEILSTLDEDNHQHSGATDGQINILPISTVKGDRVEDACVICLEVPAAGDVMRHLPCLHKFHKECIDTWLKRRNACPVCKSAIT
ncbi:RING/U-box superfamily protein [Rhynchospora pubera]|uniref:RING/U-box superfamily protein n=1 Tax=Rhynchospora pubera TaxID=906938 RepID=A0AAV8EP16_9POAL|nr:RING/U-box superfamily protein [Rhynchospora pubera]